ncbi:MULTISPECIES: hypothetical protein [unclassified Rhizobium]|nr:MULTISPECIES: hypothetical protein [unclassified Rhizobium]
MTAVKRQSRYNQKRGSGALVASIVATPIVKEIVHGGQGEATD